MDLGWRAIGTDLRLGWNVSEGTWTDLTQKRQEPTPRTTAEANERRPGRACRESSVWLSKASISCTRAAVSLGAPGCAGISGNFRRRPLGTDFPRTRRSPSATRSFSFDPLRAAVALASRKSSSGISTVVFITHIGYGVRNGVSGKADLLLPARNVNWRTANWARGVLSSPCPQ